MTYVKVDVPFKDKPVKTCTIIDSVLDLPTRKNINQVFELVCVFLTQELSDTDISDEQELCDSPVEHLQVRFLHVGHCGSTVTLCLACQTMQV